MIIGSANTLGRLPRNKKQPHFSSSGKRSRCCSAKEANLELKSIDGMCTSSHLRFKYSYPYLLDLRISANSKLKSIGGMCTSSHWRLEYSNPAIKDDNFIPCFRLEYAPNMDILSCGPTGLTHMCTCAHICTWAPTCAHVPTCPTGLTHCTGRHGIPSPSGAPTRQRVMTPPEDVYGEPSSPWYIVRKSCQVCWRY